MSLEERIAEIVRAAVREEFARVLGPAAAPDVLSPEAAAQHVAKILGKPVTAKTIRAWIAEGLPAGRRGRLRTILRADLDKWLAGKRQQDPGVAIVRSVG